MGCGCRNIQPCGQCQNGLPCNCPPDYSVVPQPTTCKCCPPGYSYTNPTLNYPNGICTNSSGGTTGPINCSECVDAVPADCVIYTLNSNNAVNCFGIADGDSLTVIFQKICNNLASTVLQQISNDSSLQTILCNISAGCPPVNSGVPIITQILNYCCCAGLTFYPDTTSPGGVGFCGRNHIIENPCEPVAC